jgi:hypothetical protein
LPPSAARRGEKSGGNAFIAARISSQPSSPAGQAGEGSTILPNLEVLNDQ